MNTEHLTDDLIAEYASGAAREGVALAVATHLTFCAESRRKVEAATPMWLLQLLAHCQRLSWLRLA